jgi:hypothetical protein
MPAGRLASYEDQTEEYEFQIFVLDENYERSVKKAAG